MKHVASIGAFLLVSIGINFIAKQLMSTFSIPPIALTLVVIASIGAAEGARRFIVAKWNQNKRDLDEAPSI